MVVSQTLQQCRHLNALSAAFTRPHRLYYNRLYPTVLVKPDGSTFVIRYAEPKQIIKLPLNIWTLSETDRKARLDSRKPKQKLKIFDDLGDNYDSKKYLKFLKK